MKFLQKLFGNGQDLHQPQSDFKSQVEKAIQLLSNAGLGLDNDQFFQLLIDNNIGEKEAEDIFLFLPIAFVRNLLTDMPWSDSYIERIGGNQENKKFSNTKSYQVINQVVSAYFRYKPNRDTIIKIAGRSAEFRVINQLLLDNPGYKLTDIQMTEACIIRK